LITFTGDTVYSSGVKNGDRKNMEITESRMKEFTGNQQGDFLFRSSDN